MSKHTKQLYEFGPFSIDAAERVLHREGQPVALTPKTFDLLLVLVENSGHLMEKDELMQRLWPGAFVEEANLPNNISLLRKALGDDTAEHQYIETVPRRGYRFVAKVVEQANEPTELIIEERTTATLTLEQDASNNTAESIITKIKRHKIAADLALAVLAVVVAALAFGLYKLTGRNNGPQPLSTTNFRRLTTGGKVGNESIIGGAAISPDGKWVAFVTADGGAWSMWLRQVSTNSLQRIVGPVAGDLRMMIGSAATTFSPDGESIYYTGAGKDNLQGSLYQVPMLGGVPRKVLSNIGGAISFSPDEKQFAFVRYGIPPFTSALMIANADGTEERTLAIHDGAVLFSHSPAWSPDGKTIACGLVSSNSAPSTLVGVAVAGGEERPLASQKWPWIFRIIWLQDGSGLTVSAAERQLAGFPLAQIWLLPYPSGEARPITNDLNGYGSSSLGLTSDSASMVTVQFEWHTQIWLIGANEDASRAKLVSEGKFDGFNGVAWTADGRIVYVTQEGEDTDIWITNSDGSGNKQLTSDAYVESGPQITPDGRYIVFISDRAGVRHIWRMNVDGSGARQLTEGDSADSHFDCSPDGRWLVYDSEQPEESSLWTVSIEGGRPMKLTDVLSDGSAFSPDGKLIPYGSVNATQPITSCSAFSPDGKLIAFGYRDAQEHGAKIAIIPAEGGPRLKTFSVPQSSNLLAGLEWSPDGRAITYIDTHGGVSNVWAQPLDGGSPRQLTKFTSEKIARFAWSLDGRLAVSRGDITSDVVLIRDFRSKR